jgi:hypothetical protein
VLDPNGTSSQVDADGRRDAAGIDAPQGDAVNPGRVVVRLKPGTSGTRSWKSSAALLLQDWPATTVTDAGISAIGLRALLGRDHDLLAKGRGFDGSSAGAGDADALRCGVGGVLRRLVGRWALLGPSPRWRRGRP